MIRNSDRGSASTELLLIGIPVTAVLIAMMLIAGRGVTARLDVESAAAAGVRAASLQRSLHGAHAAAKAAAADTLAAGRATCRAMTVAVDVSEFRPGGRVSVTVRCAVDFTDVSGLRLPGGATVSATAASVIDAWRGVA